MSRPFNFKVAGISFLISFVLISFISAYTNKSPLEIALWMLIPLIFVWVVLRIQEIFLNRKIVRLCKELKIQEDLLDELRKEKAEQNETSNQD